MLSDTDRKFLFDAAAAGNDCAESAISAEVHRIADGEDDGDDDGFIYLSNSAINKNHVGMVDVDEDGVNVYMAGGNLFTYDDYEDCEILASVFLLDISEVEFDFGDEDLNEDLDNEDTEGDSAE